MLFISLLHRNLQYEVAFQIIDLTNKYRAINKRQELAIPV